MERNERGNPIVNPANMERLCDVFAQLYREGVRPCAVHITDYDNEVEIQISGGGEAKAQMATIARLMGKCRKEYGDSNFRLFGEINGVPIKAFTWRNAVCRVVGEEEVIVPAQPATPECKVKRPIWQCDEPLLADEPREHPVSHGVLQAESDDGRAA